MKQLTKKQIKDKLAKLVLKMNQKNGCDQQQFFHTLEVIKLKKPVSSEEQVHPDCYFCNGLDSDADVFYLGYWGVLNTLVIGFDYVDGSCGEGVLNLPEHTDLIYDDKERFDEISELILKFWLRFRRRGNVIPVATGMARD